MLEHGENENTQTSSRQQTEGAANNTWSFNKGLDKSGVPSLGSESFQSFMKGFRDAKAKINAALDIELIELDRDVVSELHYSAITVGVINKKLNTRTGAFHTLILGSTNKLPPDAQFGQGMTAVKLPRVTADAYDMRLVTLIEESVTSRYPKEVEMLNTNATAVPADFEVQSEEKMVQLLIHALMACVSRINDKIGGTVMDLTKMDKTVRMEYDVTMGRHNVIDILGTPNRSSVLIEVSSRQMGAGNIDPSRVNNANTVSSVLELSAFVSAIYANPAPMHNAWMQRVPTQQVQRLPPFAPEIVITNLNYKAGPVSDAAFMYGISSIMALLSQDNWKQALLPRGRISKDKSEIDITDIGALNITADLNNEAGMAPNTFGTPFDTDVIRNDLPTFFQLVNNLFTPSTLVAVDAQMCGSSSWFTDKLVKASVGGNTTAGRRALIAAMDELTGGTFSKFFDENAAIAANVAVVPIGYYLDHEHRKCDIRDIDTIAIHNLFANDPTMIREYLNTFAAIPGQTEESALAKRESIIRQATSERAVITGRAWRITLSKEFLNAVFQSVNKAGMTIAINTPLSQDLTRAGASVPSYLQQAMMTSSYNIGGGATPQMGNPIYGRNPGMR